MNKLERRLIKRIYRRQFRPAAPIESLLDKMRTHWDDDGQGCKEYGFLDVEDADDEEIDCWLHDRLERHVNWPAQWDCSGQLFTIAIDWHRNPNGYVSFVHTMGVDV